MGVCWDMWQTCVDIQPNHNGVSAFRQVNEALQGQVWAEKENQGISYITKSRKRHKIYKKSLNFEGNATDRKMSDKKCG